MLPGNGNSEQVEAFIMPGFIVFDAVNEGVAIVRRPTGQAEEGVVCRPEDVDVVGEAKQIDTSQVK
jgi:hypothetical protein